MTEESFTPVELIDDPSADETTCVDESFRVVEIPAEKFDEAFLEYEELSIPCTCGGRLNGEPCDVTCATTEPLRGEREP